jgi:DNA topoisomerase-1
MGKQNSNGKSLVVVESPAKAKTINKYLGSEYEVKASMGHVRDLPSKGLNVDIEHNFEPHYEVLPGKKKTVGQLRSAAKKCDRLYLATDLDREGEAIAWHVAELLGKNNDSTYRVIFNAITKNAIKKAFAEPTKLDMNKVMAQQARRILDRIVGYKISPLLWKKVAGGLSAGRVQSVAVKMVVEKEREIRKFDPEEYWLIPAVFTADMDKDYSEAWKEFLKPESEDDQGPTIAQQNEWLGQRQAFKADLYKVGGEKFRAENEEQAKRIYSALSEADFKVDSIDKRESKSRPSPPFITSTLQQAAASRLGFSTKRTMMAAQQLY